MNELIRDLTPWVHPALEVRGSPISGSGLFTSENIASGTVVARFGGFLISSSERTSRISYVPGTAVGISESVMLAELPGSQKDFTDFINHSCDPCLALIDAITLQTIRDVNAGGEMTCDYAYWEVNEGYLMKEACNCGGRDCRTVVTGVDWKLRQLRLTLLARAAPFIRRRVLSNDIDAELTSGKNEEKL